MHFDHYKGFADFTLALETFNVLVGPNNSGKSTAISALRILGVGLSIANVKSPIDIRYRERTRSGYWLREDSIPVGLDNVHTEYEEIDSEIRFNLASGVHLTLAFPASGGCALLLDPEGPVVLSPTGFRRVYPVVLGIVPVLSALESDEAVLDPGYVRRSIPTSRSARHFRCYWYLFPDGFEDFSDSVAATWPGVTGLSRPQLTPDGRLMMFCVEGGRERELGWAGFGFQIWCQLITHLSRMRDVDIVVIDEPEVYLHPDLQRRLVGILQDLGPDVIVATHSSEIVTEVDAIDLLIVDKDRSRAKRTPNESAFRDALSVLGSNRNIVLSSLARTRRVLFVEGEDFKTIRRFARVLGLSHLAVGTGVVPYPLGGFPALDSLKDICRGIQSAVSEPVAFGGLFDRDFRSDAEIESFESALAKSLCLVHVWYRKEIENYLLVPTVLDRAIDAELARRASRGAPVLHREVDIDALLHEVTDPLREDVESKYVAARIAVRDKRSDDLSTAHRELMQEFKRRWEKLDVRLSLVPGKQTLASLNEALLERVGISLSAAAIVNSFHVKDVTFELATVLRQLEAFRSLDPDNPTTWPTA